MPLVLVLGANGFIGSHVAAALGAQPDVEIVGAGLGTPLPGLERRWLDLDLLAGDAARLVAELRAARPDTIVNCTGASAGSTADLIAGIFNWSMVLITQIKFRRRIGAAEVDKLTFKMPFFPVANYVVLAFLAGVVVLMGFLPDFRYALYVGPVWVAILYVAYRIKTSAHRRAAESLSV